MRTKLAALFAVLAGLAVIGGLAVGLWRQPSRDSGDPSPGTGASGISKRPSALEPGPEARLRRIERMAAGGPDAVEALARRMQSAATLAEKEEFADALVAIGTPEAIQAFARRWLAEEQPCRPPVFPYRPAC